MLNTQQQPALSFGFGVGEFELSDETGSRRPLQSSNSNNQKCAPTIQQLNSAPKPKLKRDGAIDGAVSANYRADSSANEPTKRRRKQRENRQQEAQKLPPGDESAPGGERDRDSDKDDKDDDDDDDNNNTSVSVLASKQEDDDESKEFKTQLVWRNIFLFVLLHSSLPVGGLMLWRRQVSLLTIVWSLLGIYISGIGVTGGAHRLWSHKAYKARLPVQILLMCLQTMAGQNSVYTWCRDHRAHHKYSETDADPHNIKRGFFFAHMGWLCCKKHPQVKIKGKSIDMSDLKANPVVMFQHKHFWWLSIVFNVLLPTYVPVWLWNESFWVSFTYSFLLRYLISLHGTWLVNSAAHYYGSRPYDARMEARESPVVILTAMGEGFHNYHHTFPFDYSTSEFGHYFNITTAFIDLCARLGLAYDRRSMSRALIEQRRKRTGERTASEEQKVVEEDDEQDRNGEETARTSRSSEQRLVNNLIHELPYISGLFSMKYTM